MINLDTVAHDFSPFIPVANRVAPIPPPAPTSQAISRTRSGASTMPLAVRATMSSMAMPMPTFFRAQMAPTFSVVTKATINCMAAPRTIGCSAERARTS